MSGLLRYACSATVLLALGLPLRGSPSQDSSSHRPDTFKKGQSFYVVVVRVESIADALFTLCPAPGQQVRPPSFWGLALTSPGERPVADAAVKGRIEAEFAKQRRYKVASTLEQADWALLAQATYASMAVADIRPRPGEKVDRRQPVPTYAQVGFDRPPNTLTDILAIVAPARVYAAELENREALLRAAVWQGRQATSRVATAASPEDLVRQFHGIRPTLPLDGGMSRNGDSIDDLRDAFTRDRQRQARDAEMLGRARVGTLDGRAICVSPQPERAPVMPPEREPIRDRENESGAVPPSSERTGPPGATFQSRIVAVGVPVVVTNEQGGFVGGLRAEDFRVSEDDVPQRIDRMMPESEPFTAAIAIDTSTSMLSRISDLKVATSAFIDALRPEDRAFIVAFDTRAWLLSDVTTDKQALRRAVLRLHPGGEYTRMFDALDVVTEERLERIAGRKALVVLTDGMDTASRRADGASVVKRLESDTVPVYVLQFAIDPGTTSLTPAFVNARGFDDRALFEEGRRYLQDLARNTGGLFHAASTANVVVEAFRHAADDLRSQYVLYYYPSNQAHDGRLRRIRVEVNRPGVIVRARAGYTAPGDPQ